MKGLRVRAWVLALAIVATLPAVAAEVPVPRAAYTLQAELQGDGPMAVVFESGFGQDAVAWKAVIKSLGPECRCIAYGRAGLGDSGTDGNAKTIDEHLADLDAVIATLAPGRKVVLVGHSYGGLLVSEFARQHPDRVQGLVLVDPTTMGQRHAFRQADPARVQADDAMLLSMLPPAMAADYRALVARLDSPEAATPAAMPDVPVVLLTATQVAAEPFVFEETAQGKALWRAQHGALFAQFSRGTHRYLDTGHNLHHEDPAAVVDAIREVAATGSVPD
ncbi:alpha/beta fold hydrolase [Luteimonas yindakuii]|uniref:alpha/beta fold hydrolase n=1 Tax=Luteimonas yindakuii TaxID=2565782 RepID=UPI003CCDC643